MNKIDLSTLIAIHKLITTKTGGACDVRDYNLLESAIQCPFQTFGGVELYPTVAEKGAMLGYSLISNHAFVDGNKRIGVLAMLTFLQINGITIKTTDEEIIKIGLLVASSKFKYEELLSFITANCIN